MQIKILLKSSAYIFDRSKENWIFWKIITYLLKDDDSGISEVIDARKRLAALQNQ